jgi:Bacterial protein of unknown function (DUF899)
VTMRYVSQAPFEKLQAYKRRMGWNMPWVSSAGSDFNFDLGFSRSEEQTREAIAPMLQAGPPPIVDRNASASGTDPVGYLTEGQGLTVFVLADGAVHETHRRRRPRSRRRWVTKRSELSSLIAYAISLASQPAVPLFGSPDSRAPMNRRGDDDRAPLVWRVQSHCLHVSRGSVVVVSGRAQLASGLPARLERHDPRGPRHGRVL